MTDKSNDKVGHLNTILAQGGGNLNNPIFKCSNAQRLPGGGGGGGMLKFRVDWRINKQLIVAKPRCKRAFPFVFLIESEAITREGGGGVLPYISYIGMYRPKR